MISECATSAVPSVICKVWGEVGDTLNMYLPSPAPGSCQGTWQQKHTKSLVHRGSSPVKHIVLNFSWNY